MIEHAADCANILDNLASSHPIHKSLNDPLNYLLGKALVGIHATLAVLRAAQTICANPVKSGQQDPLRGAWKVCQRRDYAVE